MALSLIAITPIKKPTILRGLSARYDCQTMDSTPFPIHGDLRIDLARR